VIVDADRGVVEIRKRSPAQDPTPNGDSP
jgi:hypothetical protein